MSSPTRDKEQVFQDIQTWPIEDLLELAQSALRRATLLTHIPAEKSFIKSEALRGILATDAAAPTDEEVERWLEEERIRKYGL